MDLPVHYILFAIVAVVAVASAFSVVFMRNPIHAALMLVVNFISIAMLYLTLNAQFLGIIQITVYAGAVVILFLFVLMLIGVSARTQAQMSTRTEVMAGSLASGSVLALLIASFVRPWIATTKELSITPSGIQLQNISNSLFTEYFWPFEVTSILLMVAAIGAMVIGRHQDKLSELVEYGVGTPPGQHLPEGSYQDALLAEADAEDDDLGFTAADTADNAADNADNAAADDADANASATSPSATEFADTTDEPALATAAQDTTDPESQEGGQA